MNLEDRAAEAREKARREKNEWKRRALAAEATLDRVRAELQYLAARDQILIRAALNGEVQQ